MANITFPMDYKTDIDYSVVDGRVRYFILNGDILFDENEGIDVDGWVTKLVELVKKRHLDVDDGIGLPKFVYKLQEDGHL